MRIDCVERFFCALFFLTFQNPQFPILYIKVENAAFHVILDQWSSTWAKSPPRGRVHALRGRFCDLRDLGGDFMRCVGDFVIYEIWGAISVSRRAISAG